MPELLRRDLRHKDAPGLAAVTELLETGTCEVPPAAPEVRLFAAASREEEARCTAAAIRRLMRQGVRCGKMAVVCRNIPDYRAAIRYEFRMADIPLYCDEPTTPEFSAPATAVRALLALLRGADMTENLTILAKTGLCARPSRRSARWKTMPIPGHPMRQHGAQNLRKAPRASAKVNCPMRMQKRWRMPRMPASCW